jgi:hypothetical protein
VLDFCATGFVEARGDDARGAAGAAAFGEGFASVAIGFRAALGVDKKIHPSSGTIKSAAHRMIWFRSARGALGPCMAATS